MQSRRNFHIHLKEIAVKATCRLTNVILILKKRSVSACKQPGKVGVMVDVCVAV